MKQKRITKSLATQAVDKILQWIDTLPPDQPLGYSFKQDGYLISLCGWSGNMRIYAFDDSIQRFMLVDANRVCKLDAKTLVALTIRLVEQWPLVKAALLTEAYGRPDWAEQLESFQP
jgi:hypothetical protein